MLACLRLAAVSAGLRARASAQHRERREYPAASLALESPRQRMHALRPPLNTRPRLSAQQSYRSCLARRTCASRSRWHRRPCPVSLLLCSLLLRFLALSSLSFALASLRCLVWLLSPSRVLHALLAPSSSPQTHKQTHKRRNGKKRRLRRRSPSVLAPSWPSRHRPCTP